MISLDQAADKIVQCMGVKEGEKVLVITDKNKIAIGRAIEKSSLKITSTKLIEIPIGKQHGEEPSDEVAMLMKLFDVVIIPTSMSLSHTNARREANKAGARIATLPKATEDLLCRTMEADYDKIKERTDKLCDILDDADEVIVMTEKGTKITMSIKGRVCNRDHGVFSQEHNFSNLPAGEACLAPVEGSSKGMFIVDANFGGVGELDEDIKLEVDDGYVISIEGGKAADKLKKMLEQVGDEAFNIAELGIGTNDKAVVSGNTLEDEKVMGTAHIAVGDNKTYGGKIDVPIHLDGIFYKPTILIDGQKVMDNGELLI